MYQIQELNITIANGVHEGEWWTGKKWTPAQNEGKVYDTIEEAQFAIDEEVTREAVIVDTSDNTVIVD